MDDFFHSTKGQVDPSQLTSEAQKTEHLQDVSAHRVESRLVVQKKTVTLDIGAHSKEEGTGIFHIGAMDDPRIIMPLGCDVTIQFYNWDSKEEHGWRLVDAEPPFDHPESLDQISPAFPGADIPATAFGSSRETTFVADHPGTFTYFCPVPTHTHVGQYSQVEVRFSH